MLKDPPSIQKLQESLLAQQQNEDVQKALIKETVLELNDIQGKMYDINKKILYTKEIYRLAAHHFPRLRKEELGNLTKNDVAELEKWIGRIVSDDGYLSIISAIKELSKYYPSDIKTNLYGLVQKIIAEGAYGKGLKRR